MIKSTSYTYIIHMNYLLRLVHIKAHNRAGHYFFLVVALSFFTGCAGAGDDTTNTTITNTFECVFAESEQSCIEIDGGFSPEGESNDLECNEGSNGNVTSICGPAITIEAAISDGDNDSLSRFLAEGIRLDSRYLTSDYADSE